MMRRFGSMRKPAVSALFYRIKRRCYMASFPITKIFACKSEKSVLAFRCWKKRLIQKERRIYHAEKDYNPKQNYETDKQRYVTPCILQIVFGRQ